MIRNVERKASFCVLAIQKREFQDFYLIRHYERQNPSKKRVKIYQ